MDVVMRAVKIAALNLYGATPNPGFEAQVVLFSNVVTLTDSLIPADLDIIDVAGMEAKPDIIPDPAYDTGDGTVVLPYLVSPFTATAADDLPVTVQGWAILNGAGTAVLDAALLDNPVPIDQIGDGIVISPFIRWGA